MKKEGFISTTLVYTFLILFLFLLLAILNAYAQKNKFLDAIKDKINDELIIKSNSTLYNKIITDNRGGMSDENINFAYTSEGKTFDSNGNETTDPSQITKGLYYTSNLSLTEDLDGDGIGERVYYYRGAVTNNNVRFGGYCWRIVRTNEDGSIRMRYNGTYENGTCPTTGTDVKINSQNYAFYGSYNNEKYNEYIWEDGTGESLAKTTIDAWYTSSGLEDYEDQIANVPYCADKSNPTVPTTGDYTAYTFYGAANRLVDITTFSVKSDAQPTYKCPDTDDKHTVAGDSWGGNGKLSFPIGLLTADDVIYAGGGMYLKYDSSNDNKYYYLYTGSATYWTMSPARFGVSAISFYVSSAGLFDFGVDGERGFLPVISLKTDVTVESTGDGSYTNPYIVLTD